MRVPAAHTDLVVRCGSAEDICGAGGAGRAAGGIRRSGAMRQERMHCHTRPHGPTAPQSACQLLTRLPAIPPRAATHLFPGAARTALGGGQQPGKVIGGQALGGSIVVHCLQRGGRRESAGRGWAGRQQWRHPGRKHGVVWSAPGLPHSSGEALTPARAHPLGAARLFLPWRRARSSHQSACCRPATTSPAPPPHRCRRPQAWR